jgi:hypothetical protein
MSKERKSNAGRKPFDVVLMFKVLVLHTPYSTAAVGCVSLDPRGRGPPTPSVVQALPSREPTTR